MAVMGMEDSCQMEMMGAMGNAMKSRKRKVSKASSNFANRKQASISKQSVKM